MKNLVKLNTTAECYDCKINGFFMYSNCSFSIPNSDT